MAVVQTGLLFGLLLWKVHFIDQRFVITRSERVWSCWVERLGRGVRRVRGSTGPTTGIGSPQHVRAVKSPRPSFFVSSPCSLMSISVKFAIYNCLGLCTSLLLFWPLFVFSPGGGCSLKKNLFEILQPLLLLGVQAFLSYAFPSVCEPGSGAMACVISERNLVSSAGSLTHHAWASLLKLTEHNTHPASSLCLGPPSATAMPNLLLCCT